MDQRDEKKRSIPAALSPERGQLIVALVRMKINLSSLNKAGAIFENCDLRGFDLRGANFSAAKLGGCDLSFSNLIQAEFRDADLSSAIMRDVQASNAKFENAQLVQTIFDSSNLTGAIFDRARFFNVAVKNSDVTGSSFARALRTQLVFQDVLARFKELPAGIPWPPTIEAEFAAAKERSDGQFRFTFEAPPTTSPVRATDDRLQPPAPR